MLDDRRDRSDRSAPARPLGRGRARVAGLAVAVLAGVLVLDRPAACGASTIDRKARAIAAEQPPVLSLKDALFHDAASPTVGNPDGDVTIVAFVDYNCAYCKKSEANLDALVADDPKIKIVYKDWPILAKTSVAAAKVAIAAQWQGKYAEMHRALMQLGSHTVTDADLSQAAVAAGVDIGRLNKDLDARDDEIVALLKRNIAEADALGAKGTPVYLIGPFMTASPLDLSQFKQIVADARADQAKGAEPTPAGDPNASAPDPASPGAGPASDAAPPDISFDTRPSASPAR